MVTNAVVQDILTVREFRQSVFQNLDLAAYMQQESANYALASDVHDAGGRHAHHLMSVDEIIHGGRRVVERHPRLVRQVPPSEIRGDRCDNYGHDRHHDES